jgi:two-component system, LytTR family, response regulator
MRPVRVLVVEDEALARERVVALVRATPELELLGEATHGLEALDRITALHPDLVLLDIEMPELNGFEIVAALDESSMPGIVFITAFEDYALQAFEVDAIDYLQKPVTPERFAAAVQRAIGRLAQARVSRASVARALTTWRREGGGYRTRFVVRTRSTHAFVPVHEVVWIDAADNYLQLHAGGRARLVRGTIKDAEAELDPAAFLRIHRSAIVSIGHVVAIEAQAGGGYVLRLTDGTRLRTSRQYAAGVRALVEPRRR